MGGAKLGDQEVRIDEVSIECAEKTGFPGFGAFRKGGNCILRGPKTASQGKMQLAGPAGSKDGGWIYTEDDPRVQNGNSG
jgi:hypothetical protein